MESSPSTEEDEEQRKTVRKKTKGYRRKENDMVIEKENLGDSSTDYDNIKSVSRESVICPGSGTSQSDVDEFDADPQLNTARSLSSTPKTLVSQESQSTYGGDADVADRHIQGKVQRSTHSLDYGTDNVRRRPYRIIDSCESQQLLEQLIVEKMAAVQTTERSVKGPRLLRAKSGNNIYTKKNQSRSCDYTSRLHPKDKESSPNFMVDKHSFVIRTTSFGNNKYAEKNYLENRKSIPGSVTIRDNQRDSVTKRRTESSASDFGISDMFANTVSLGSSRSSKHEDSNSFQRLSIVSSSTGYSSARSSMRSSETGDETSFSQIFDTSFDRRTLSQNTSLSESRRQKLLESQEITHLDRIAMELLETERSYVNDLNDIIQGYLNFFIDHRDQLGITVDDISGAFGCVERLYFFNRHLYHQLDSALLNVVEMAKCFEKNADGFGDYVTYCTNYQKMATTLSTLTKNEFVAETLSQRQAFLHHSLPLNAYLLKPVQRVLKYHLFLENIMKNAEEMENFTENDRATIRRAYECMTAQAERINDEKRRVEYAERVRELQSALQRWSFDQNEDLSKYGDLLLEATFKLAGSKTNRQLFLFEEVLLIVKERSGSLICKDFIMCSTLMLNEWVASDPLAFQVLSFEHPKTRYIFLASNVEQKREWVKELKRMMLDHYTVIIPEKTKNLMINMDLTKNPPLACDSLSSNTSKQNGKVIRYIEKKRKSYDANVARHQKMPDNFKGRLERTMHKASSTSNLNSENTDFQTRMASAGSSSHIAYPYQYALYTEASTSNALSATSYSNCSSGTSNTMVDNRSYVQPSSTQSYSRRKSSDTLKAQGCGERRRNTAAAHKPPLPASINAHSVNDLQSNIVAWEALTKSKQRQCTSTRPNSAEVNADGSSDKVGRERSASSEKIENTFSALYKELHMFVNNADALDEVLLNAKSRAKRNKRFHEKVDGQNQDVNSILARSRSKSLGGLNVNSEEQAPVLSESINCDDSCDRIFVNVVDADSDAFINGSIFGKLVDDELNTTAKDDHDDRNNGNDDGESGTTAVNWTESPRIRDKTTGLMPHGVHHRRRSSQVAEQVWRHRQKQNIVGRAGDLPLSHSSDTSVNPPNVVEQRNDLTSNGQLTTNSEDSNNSSKASSGHFLQSTRRHSSGAFLARQRSPLTVEQCVQLNKTLLAPNVGIVKEMIKQLESPISSV